MKRLNILHIEDEPNHQLLAEVNLLGADFDYQLDAVTTRQAGLEILDEIGRGEQEPYDVYLLDANQETPGKTGEDGRAFVERKRELNLGGFVIGVSAERMDYYGIEVDYDLGKQKWAELGDVLGQLAVQDSDAA
jgi:CheY-like chemotaxis protein